MAPKNPLLPKEGAGVVGLNLFQNLKVNAFKGFVG